MGRGNATALRALYACDLVAVVMDGERCTGGQI